MPLVRLWEDTAKVSKGYCPLRLLTTGENLPVFCLAGRAVRYIPRNLRQRPVEKRRECALVVQVYTVYQGENIVQICLVC